METKRTKAIKKSAKQNKRRRKRNKIRLLLVLLIATFLIVGVLLLTVVFPIKQIKVIGETRYDSAAIISASGVLKGDKLFSVNEKRIENLILEKLPYIKRILLQRSIPDTLIIKVTADKAVYQITQEDKYLFLNEDFKLLEISTEINNEAVCLQGLEIKTNGVSKTVKIVNTDKKDKILKIENEFNKLGIKIKEVNVTDELNLKAVINNNLTVNFGTITDFDYKVLHLKSMLDNLPENATGAIDLKSWSAETPKGYYINQ